MASTGAPAGAGFRKNRSVTTWLQDRQHVIGQPIDHQPRGKVKKRNVRKTGSNNIILACVGSMVVGMIFCWSTIDAPIRIGNT